MASLTDKQIEILSLFNHYGELFGMELITRSKLLTRGTVYVWLSSLTDMDLISWRLVPGAGGRPARRKYRLTESGKLELALASRTHTVQNASG